MSAAYMHLFNNVVSAHYDCYSNRFSVFITLCDKLNAF